MSSRPSSTTHDDHHHHDDPRHDDPRHDDPGHDDHGRPHAPQTFGQRHGLKILGLIGATLFITVIAAQVGC
jgi:hypothetical protein